MNKQSNTYIVTYATILVVVVAAVLSFAAIKLQPLQQRNADIEKMSSILGTIGEGKDADKASDKNAYVIEQYKKYITESYTVNAEGEKTDGDAFKALDNLPEVFAAKDGMPVFVATLGDGKTEYVVPMTGTGLWGPVWGYMALNDDCNTVVGAVFSHKGETPGLGAEISTPAFGNQFIDKRIFNKDGEFVSVTLLKGVGSSAGNPNAVDAISGGTLTSNGVKAMLMNCLGDYVPFFKKIQAGVIANTADTTATIAADSTAQTQTTEGGAK